MKARKSVARNRWARSIPLQWDTNQYTLDLEKGYRPVGQKNTSTGPVIGQQEEEEGFTEAQAHVSHFSIPADSPRASRMEGYEGDWWPGDTECRLSSATMWGHRVKQEPQRSDTRQERD